MPGSYALDTNVVIALLSDEPGVVEKWQLAQVRSSLAAIGRSIPENDVWVAACAQAADAIRVTRDRHFVPVKDLQLAEW